MTQLKLALLTLSVACLVNLSNASDQNVFIKKDNQNPIISAHRSGSGIAPKNTLKAFESVTNNSNFDVGLIEIDVQLTKDNQLILLHDKSLNRISNAAEFFKQNNVTAAKKRYDELYQLNLGEFFVNESCRPFYWTVNNVKNMKILKENNADGIITYYPDKAWETFYDNATVLNQYKIYSASCTHSIYFFNRSTT